MGQIFLQISQGWENADYGVLWTEACNKTGTITTNSQKLGPLSPLTFFKQLTVPLLTPIADHFSQLSLFFFHAGPNDTHPEILHPPQDRLHRQALLLWRGNRGEVSANTTWRGNARALWDKQVEAARWTGGLQGQSVKAKWTVAQTIPEQWAGAGNRWQTLWLQGEGTQQAHIYIKAHYLEQNAF